MVKPKVALGSRFKFKNNVFEAIFGLENTNF
jgi:hypothetical protein